MCSMCAMNEEGKIWCPNCYILSFPKALNQSLDNLDKPKFPSPETTGDKNEVVA
jgi:hypothetical protein